MYLPNHFLASVQSEATVATLVNCSRAEQVIACQIEGLKLSTLVQIHTLLVTSYTLLVTDRKTGPWSHSMVRCVSERSH